MKWIASLLFAKTVDCDDVDCRAPLVKTTKTLVLVVDGQRSWPSLRGGSWQASDVAIQGYVTDVDCRASFAKTDTSLDEGTGAVVFASHSTAIHVVTSFVFVDRRVPRLRARTSRRQPPSPSSFASATKYTCHACPACAGMADRQSIPYTY